MDMILNWSIILAGILLHCTEIRFHLLLILLLPESAVAIATKGKKVAWMAIKFSIVFSLINLSLLF